MKKAQNFLIKRKEQEKDLNLHPYDYETYALPLSYLAFEKIFSSFMKNKILRQAGLEPTTIASVVQNSFQLSY